MVIPDVLEARRRRHGAALRHGLRVLYRDAAQETWDRLAEVIDRAATARPPELHARDLLREAEPDWFQRPDMVGYVAYADRFAGTLCDISDRLDYLAELGVTYLHLMPLLRSREGESDGGYAVASYEEVEPRLGTMADLADLASRLHEHDMNLCVDLVLNHTAAEHPWAEAARAGDERFRRFYFCFPDRTMPDRYERTLREVFPTFAPGNFTWLDDAQQWVWTTFNDFQWDLDWSNPDVFVAMAEVMLNLANQGVDALRLDAVPFMWKREGTDCENLPEVHELLRTLRALMAIAAPATIFKAEAIVPPAQLTPYLGAGDPEYHECELAYHNQLMVMLWSSLATGEAQMMTESLRNVAAIPTHTSWVTYVRCHDDIGWAITDEAAASVGRDGFAHRNFLNRFYSGEFPVSFARGAVFQFNPETGDGRISGSAASLCGIELALEHDDQLHLDIACRRLELAYAVAYAFGGIPLLYMGDELGMRNDHSYLAKPEHSADNRWMHRPTMDWSVAERRHVDGTLEHRLFAMFTGLARDRASAEALHGAGRVDLPDSGDPRVLAIVRHHPNCGRFAMVANFSTDAVTVDLCTLGLDDARVTRNGGVAIDGSALTLPSLAYVWFSAE